MNSVKNHWGEGWTHYSPEDKVGDAFSFEGKDWVVVKHLTREEAVAFSAPTKEKQGETPPSASPEPDSSPPSSPECYWCEDTEGVTLVKSCQLYGCRECAEECGQD
jgi:hypothetical protein